MKQPSPPKIICRKCYQGRDYLNEFQICNSCCIQMEQMSPSGFKSNFKFEYCNRCYRRGDYLNEFQICYSCCKKMEQEAPSGFKPNFKFEYCNRCYRRRDYLNKFQICDSCCRPMEKEIPSRFKPSFFMKCMRCRQRGGYFNEFRTCYLCCKQMASGVKPSFIFMRCRRCRRRCRRRGDYFNEFQICNSCCKQVEQEAPSGFKPNFRSMKCRGCHQRSDYLNEFDECISCEKCKRCNKQRRDYLNKFQICNSCCEQMVQEAPSGFKPNFRFMKCSRCHQRSDCLNEFQNCICNSCYKHIEQITPSGYKPNFKFMECEKCHQRKDYLNVFQICSSCSSGNKVIDDFLTNRVTRKMKFVPYNRFKYIVFIAEGGFSKIYKATWSHDDSKMTVALKELSNSKNINYKELNELNVYNDLVDNNNISGYYGITQSPITKNFMIIMKYYKSGDLTHYITNRFFILSWYYKLSMLSNIIIGLKNIHDANIVHKDYHSGNIFIGDKIVTGDLGISKSAMADDDNEIYGIIPYVAPEIFQGEKYTKASDIYSFGMIMWELMTGRRPFWDQNHDADLIIEICDGFRPPIVNIMPKGYIELMQECWHPDPNKRPTAVDLINKITTIKNYEYKNPTKIIKSPDIGPITANNPCAIYKSRSLRAMIKSAESTRSLKSQKIISEIDKKDKRKFDDDQIEDRIIKKIRQSENNELGFDVDQSKSNDYLTKEFGFDI